MKHNGYYVSLFERFISNQRKMIMTEYIVNPGEIINDTINKTEYGDIVRSNPGLYQKQVVIVDKPGITVLLHDAIIDGEYLFPQGNIARRDPRSDKYHVWEGLLDITASDVTVEGGEVIRSLGRGIRIFNNIQNVLLKNINAHQIRETGLLINQDTQQITLDGIDISRTNNFAPYSRGSGELDWGSGIAIKGKKVNLLKCRVFENWGEGILVFGVGAEDVMMSDCNAFNNYALQLYIDHGINIRIHKGMFYFDNPEFYRGGKPTTSIAIANEEWLGPDHLASNIEITEAEFWGGNYHFGLWDPVKNVLFAQNILRDATEGVFQSFGSPNENVRIIENEIYHEDETKIFVFESDIGIEYSGNFINPDLPPDPEQDHKEILERLDKLEADQNETTITLLAHNESLENLATAHVAQETKIQELGQAQIDDEKQFMKIRNFFAGVRDLLSEFLG